MKISFIKCFSSIAPILLKQNVSSIESEQSPMQILMDEKRQSMRELNQITSTISPVEHIFDDMIDMRTLSDVQMIDIIILSIFTYYSQKIIRRKFKKSEQSSSSYSRKGGRGLVFVLSIVYNFLRNVQPVI